MVTHQGSPPISNEFLAKRRGAKKKLVVVVVDD